MSLNIEWLTWHFIIGTWMHEHGLYLHLFWWKTVLIDTLYYLVILIELNKQLNLKFLFLSPFFILIWNMSSYLPTISKTLLWLRCLKIYLILCYCSDCKWYQKYKYHDDYFHRTWIKWEGIKDLKLRLNSDWTGNWTGKLWRRSRKGSFSTAPQ